MKRITSSVTILLGLVFAGLSTGVPQALAATPAPAAGAGSGQALEIAPPLITLTVNPGQVVKTQIQLRDISKSPLVVTNQINDFVADGEDGTPKILTSSDSNNPYSMKSWISPLPQFQLTPQQIENLEVIIKVPANASPGGHYGVIRFTGVPPQLNTTGVSLSASLGSLILLTVNGKLSHQLGVQEFSVNNGGKAGSVFQSAPLNFLVRLKNTGNVQEQPTGHVAVYDMFGKNIANVNVNIPPRNVLPGSIRAFSQQLGKSTIGNKHLFGHYRATLHITYASNRQLTANLGFWIIPYKLIVGIIAGLIVVFFVLRFLIRRYNRLIVNRAQKP